MDVRDVLRKNCPIRETVEIINRKWVVILLWDMFNGISILMNLKRLILKLVVMCYPILLNF